jgi:hypothetical protein
MSNPWTEVYKDLRSEILGEEELQERRKLRDVKTAARQGSYDLKSRVAKMKAQGKTDLEIKQWLDRYLQNSELPGEQKSQMRQQALSAGFEFEGDQIDEIAPIVAAPLVVGGAVAAYKGLQHLKKKGDEALKNARSNYAGSRERQVQDILKQSYEQDGDDIQEVAPPTAKGERMVKHIKAGYKKGGLTKKEKSIAYATSWKQHNKEKEANEEFVFEESERVLVRITTEDGRVFEKKVPKDKIQELRQRYKSVVEVGSSERKPQMTSKKDVKESSHVKRWWDDDGDRKGYEEGEVEGKFKKKKKKTRKEDYSDWRDEMQLDEEELGLTPKEMRQGVGEKKNEDPWEDQSKFSECDDFGTWTESEELLVNQLAETLGGELVDLEVFDEAKIPKFKDLKQAQQIIGQLKDKIDDLIDIKPYERGGQLAVRGPGGKVSTSGRTAGLSKPQSSTSTVTKPETIQRVRVKDITKEKDKITVSIDTKTGAITRQVKPTALAVPSPQTKTQTQTQTQTQTRTGTRPPVPPSLPPRRPPIGGIPGGGGNFRLPKLGIALGEPKNVGKVVNV